MRFHYVITAHILFVRWLISEVTLFIAALSYMRLESYH